jgi:tetratricopeptide (TPR) repeat protein
MENPDMKLGIHGIALLGLTATLMAAGGCNHTAAPARQAIGLYQVGEFPQAEATLKPEIVKKDENFVLNNCRYGSCALAAGDLEGAWEAFMAAYEVINSVNTNDGGRTLGAAVVFEGVKVWKGEPFERAMAHYYLGLVCLKKHDYENARSAFQNSLFKLREYANKDDPEHYQAAETNFALGYFGLGFCYLRLHKSDLAEANFKLAIRTDPKLAAVVNEVNKPGVNTLIFVDAGMGPRRAAKGWYNEESAFGPTPAERGPITPVVVLADGKPIGSTDAQHYMLDTLAMAQEQKWQDIDTLRKVKAAVGTGMMAGGAGMAAYGSQRGDQRMALAGLGVALAGAAVAASSQADLRCWEMLPRTVYVVPAALTPGTHHVVVEGGNSMTMALDVAVEGPDPAGAPRDTVLYFRALDGGPVAPPVAAYGRK